MPIPGGKDGDSLTARDLGLGDQAAGDRPHDKKIKNTLPIIPENKRMRNEGPGLGRGRNLISEETVPGLGGGSLVARADGPRAAAAIPFPDKRYPDEDLLSLVDQPKALGGRVSGGTEFDLPGARALYTRHGLPQSSHRIGTGRKPMLSEPLTVTIGGARVTVGGEGTIVGKGIIPLSERLGHKERPDRIIPEIRNDTKILPGATGSLEIRPKRRPQGGSA